MKTITINPRALIPPLKATLASLVMLLALALPISGYTQTDADIAKIQQFLSLMQDYFKIIDATHEVASDAEKSAIFQMQKIQEIYGERGEKAKALEVFRQVLKTTKNPSIRNAAYMLMGDALKETGRSDEAIKILQEGLRQNMERAE